MIRKLFVLSIIGLAVWSASDLLIKNVPASQHTAFTVPVNGAGYSATWVMIFGASLAVMAMVAVGGHGKKGRR